MSTQSELVRRILLTKIEEKYTYFYSHIDQQTNSETIGAGEQREDYNRRQDASILHGGAISSVRRAAAAPLLCLRQAERPHVAAISVAAVCTAGGCRQQAANDQSHRRQIVVVSRRCRRRSRRRSRLLSCGAEVVVAAACDVSRSIGSTSSSCRCTSRGAAQAYARSRPHIVISTAACCARDQKAHTFKIKFHAHLSTPPAPLNTQSQFFEKHHRLFIIRIHAHKQA